LGYITGTAKIGGKCQEPNLHQNKGGGGRQNQNLGGNRNRIRTEPVKGKTKGFF